MKRYYTIIILLLIFSSCRVTRYVPQDQYLLDKVKITADSKEIDPAQFKTYLRQQPNTDFLGMGKMKLALYSSVKDDTTKWWPKTIRKLGEPPVIYDSYQTLRSVMEIERSLHNSGYMEAQVDTSVFYNAKKQRVTVAYQIHLNEPYRIHNYRMDLPADDSISYFIRKDSSIGKIKPGGLFDSKILDEERNRIVTALRNKGYYYFEKDYLYFEADSVSLYRKINLVLKLRPPVARDGRIYKEHPRYKIGQIYFVSGYDPLQGRVSNTFSDTVSYKNIHLLYDKLSDIRPSVLEENCFLSPGGYYSQKEEEKTYEELSMVSALKYVNIRMVPGKNDNELNCLILLTLGKNLSLTASVEGTNSAGDFGVAGSIGFTHNNLFRGSEKLKLKVRGAYETISGVSNFFNSFTEVGVETSITFPQFLFPFINSNIRKSLRAFTEFGVSYNTQSRPEFSRDIAGFFWRYKWINNKVNRHQIDLLDISYVYLPYISDDFANNYLKDDSYLKFSYENHFIMKLGYTYSYTNSRPNTHKDFIFNIRGSVETAGNLLYGIYQAAAIERVPAGYYTIFNAPFSQYVKGDFDFSALYRLGDNASLAFHGALGVALPYGNSSILPFEKRYLSGGANSVRGWTIRSLGPGSYKQEGGINFMNQSGDIKLDLSVEARFKIVSVLEGAFFVDAGNIWTIKDYLSQIGGEFRFDNFYRQIALAYGIGIRFNFDFFIIRLDLGAKLFDPSEFSGQNWRFFQAGLGDLALHFAIGYPF